MAIAAERRTPDEEMLKAQSDFQTGKLTKAEFDTKISEWKARHDKKAREDAGDLGTQS